MNTIIENIDTIETGGQSATAAVCEQAQLFGATPERDEFDSREVWDADEATGAVCEAFRIIAQGACPDGLQLADERESLLWGFVNMLDAQTQRLDRAADKLGPELRDLQRDQDGTEIKSFELELLTDRARNLTDRRDAFETMRDAAAEQYRAVTGNTWRPRRGSHTSQTGQLFQYERHRLHLHRLQRGAGHFCRHPEQFRECQLHSVEDLTDGGHRPVREHHLLVCVRYDRFQHGEAAAHRLGQRGQRRPDRFQHRRHHPVQSMECKLRME